MSERMPTPILENVIVGKDFVPQAESHFDVLHTQLKVREEGNPVFLNKVNSPKVVPSIRIPRSSIDGVRRTVVQANPEFVTDVAAPEIVENAVVETAVASKQEKERDPNAGVVILKPEVQTRTAPERTTTPENIENLKQELTTVRLDYFKELSQYEKNLRVRKERFAQALADLGGHHRHLPEESIPQDLIQAEQTYCQAKKALYDSVDMDTMDSVERAEYEAAGVRNKRMESFSLFEKGMVRKTDAVWNRTPKQPRIDTGIVVLEMARLTHEADTLPFAAYVAQVRKGRRGVPTQTKGRVDGVRMKV